MSSIILQALPITIPQLLFRLLELYLLVLIIKMIIRKIRGKKLTWSWDIFK